MAKALLAVVRVVGDDQVAQVVVGDVLRQDNLAAERVGDALLQELGSVRPLGEVRRLADRVRLPSTNSMYQLLVLRSFPWTSRYVRWKTLPDPFRLRAMVMGLPVQPSG